MAMLSQIEHIVVVMLENRSFDSMCGWLYRDGQPSHYLPQSSAKQFNGLNSSLFNPVSDLYFSGGSKETYPIFDQANATNMPDLDPYEDLPNVNYQLFGPETPSTNPKWPNLGFVINYAKTTGTNIPVQIMEPFSPAQVPVLSALARNYAISDAWFSSVPSNTWPNRSFFHAGTSNGNVANGAVPNPFNWNVPTIFNVLESVGVKWRVYSDAGVAPALTWLMFPRLWQYSLDRFSHFAALKQDCASGTLPQYSFIEPSFLDQPNDEHPPHDVVAGEQFLWDIWQAVSKSPLWPKMMLVITYDEHGGTYDHVMPPWGAAFPDAKSNPGEQGFTFNRFGVRVPLVVVSPWIEAGTVFRSDASDGTPYDHTSVLATLRDWLKIPSNKMLGSGRIAKAPTLAQLIMRSTARTDLPTIPQPAAEVKETATFRAPNDLQKSLASAFAVKQGQDPQQVLGNLNSRQEIMNYLRSGGGVPGSAGKPI